MNEVVEIIKLREMVIQLYDEVRDVVAEEGLRQTMLCYSRKRIDEADFNMLKAAQDWLKAFQDVIIKELRAVEDHIPAERWANYRAMGVMTERGNHIPWEVEQRQKVVEKMLEHWRARPYILRKSGTKDEIKLYSGKRRSKKSGVRSSQAGTT